MNLDTTVKFIEAKESGKKAGVYLDSEDACLNKVTGYRQAQREYLIRDNSNPTDVVGNEKCHYCGRRGHGAKPDLNQKKELCPAFDKKCNSCGKIGHFARSKACRMSALAVENLNTKHSKRYQITKDC